MTNENIAPSEVTDNVEDERGMPSGASPTLIAWIFLEYYLGVPWASPSLGFITPSSPHIDIPPKT